MANHTSEPQVIKRARILSWIFTLFNALIIGYWFISLLCNPMIPSQISIFWLVTSTLTMAYLAPFVLKFD